jgi:hypothetical protein
MSRSIQAAWFPDGQSVLLCLEGMRAGRPRDGVFVTGAYPMVGVYLGAAGAVTKAARFSVMLFHARGCAPKEP